MNDPAYKTVSTAATASITEKKSEFIAHAAPATTEAEALAVLENVRAAHRTASHNVYAYRLRANSRERYSDDGEPAKTAGLPVLSVLRHAELTDSILVVTRYFGGTLLGTGGLVRAYTDAAKSAIAAAGIAEITLCATLTVAMPYSFYDTFARVAAGFTAAVAEPVFAGDITAAVTLAEADAPRLAAALTEASAGKARVETGDPFYAPLAAGAGPSGK